MVIGGSRGRTRHRVRLDGRLVSLAGGSVPRADACLCGRRASRIGQVMDCVPAEDAGTSRAISVPASEPRCRPGSTAAPSSIPDSRWAASRIPDDTVPTQSVPIAGDRVADRMGREAKIVAVICPRVPRFLRPACVCHNQACLRGMRVGLSLSRRCADCGAVGRRTREAGRYASAANEMGGRPGPGERADSGAGTGPREDPVAELDGRRADLRGQGGLRPGQGRQWQAPGSADRASVHGAYRL